MVVKEAETTLLTLEFSVHQLNKSGNNLKFGKVNWSCAKHDSWSWSWNPTYLFSPCQRNSYEVQESTCNHGLRYMQINTPSDVRYITGPVMYSGHINWGWDSRWCIISNLHKTDPTALYLYILEPVL